MVPLLRAKVLLEKGHLGECALRRVGFAEVQVLREGVLAAGEGALAEFPANEAEACEDQDSDYGVLVFWCFGEGVVAGELTDGANAD